MVYQFSVSYNGGAFWVVRDANLSNTFYWTPMQEGYYAIRVAVMATNYQGQMSVAYAGFLIVSRVTGSAPVVGTTNNPLVALYSAPSCANGSIYVEFGVTPSDVYWQRTNAQTCTPLSSNFYVAGMTASTTYQMRHIVTQGSKVTKGPVMTFTTGAIAAAIPSLSLAVNPTSQTSLADRVVLHGMLNTQNLAVNVPFATDLAGNVIWYYNGFASLTNVLAYLTRPVAGGTMLVLASQGKADAFLTEIDLAGNPIRQTDMLRIDAQLAALGKDQVSALHHDAVRFPNGQTLVIGMIERPTSNGSSILGDMIIALDQNFQVKWTWNAFDHLSTSRAPVLGETCLANYGLLCPAQNLFAVDWLHSNSISYTPDHNLLLSMRDQDWVIKINYQDGTGPGDIIWTLGAGGNFTLQSPDPYPWFSHQHDVNWLGTNQITLFDNGNTRCVFESPCDSRGQVLQLDETNYTASLVFNGDYEFGPGYIVPALTSAAMEMNPSGTVTYNLQIGATEYRTFRMQSLYVPPFRF